MPEPIKIGIMDDAAIVNCATSDAPAPTFTLEDLEEMYRDLCVGGFVPNHLETRFDHFPRKGFSC